MIQSTKPVSQVVLRGSTLQKVIHALLYRELREILALRYQAAKQRYFGAEWILFSCGGQRGYYCSSEEKAIAVCQRYESAFPKECFGGQPIELDDKQAEALFGKDLPEEILSGIRASRSFGGGHWIGLKQGSYCLETGQFANWNDKDSIKAGIASMGRGNFERAVLSLRFVAEGDEELKKAACVWREREVSEISESEIDELTDIFGVDKKKVEGEVHERISHDFVMTPDMAGFYIEELLRCDTDRADLERYDGKCLEDVNGGHWELWREGEAHAGEGEFLAGLENPLIARNPAADIHEDGLIGIDFGTRSTIVSIQDGRAKTSLLRIGIGQLAKAAEPGHYENPTIMEFLDLSRFLADYEGRAGRPDTRIDDLRVSHAAEQDLKSCSDSDLFYSFFYDLKQWCGDTERSVKIIDQKKRERVLPAFVELEEDGFNPLELYAYYIGLYINNMRNGIYLNYLLSFPVTYEKAVKEKILAGFTKGLKKSLPESVLQEEKWKGRFRVRQGVSEPAAYAITALQGYGFEPEEGEKVYYAIFDFGGGTTDFDFGLWRLAREDMREEERYDYVIEHFRAEGDKYLGGENLLERLAFEIFKANAPFLQKRRSRKGDKDPEERGSAGFSFSKPKECDAFPGSETLISDSQEAKRNTRQLMEALRPFWEGILGTEDGQEAASQENRQEGTVSYEGYVFENGESQFPIKEGAVTVDLFDKDGRRQANQKLYVKSQPNGIDLNLTGILEERIGQGVENFFQAVTLSFENASARNSGVDQIQIFLAGNSSRSPILRKLFERRITEMNQMLKEKKGAGEKSFVLFPPLGTPEAFALQRERQVPADESDITAPTGKTGVAYGLIAGRTSGKIRVISEMTADSETRFRYNIGKEKRGRFRMVLDRNDAEYGKWVRFIDAGETDFEIYYTSLPIASKLAVEDASVHMRLCRIPQADLSADIYIRPVSPQDIEYCVSRNGEPGETVEESELFSVHLDD